MAIDASIYNAVQPPPSPLQNLSAITQIKAQQQNQQINALTLEEKQRQMAAETALNNAMSSALDSSGNIDEAKFGQALVGTPAASKWPEIQQHFAALREAKQKASAAEADQVGALAAAADAAGPDPEARASVLLTGIAGGVRDGSIQRDHGLSILQQVMGPDGNPDPDAVTKMIAMMKARSQKQTELGSARITADARKTQADVAAGKAAAELPGIQAKTAVEQQVAAGTVGGITPDQQAQLKLSAQQRAIAAGQLAVAQTREKREAATDVGVSLTPEGLDMAAENFAKTGQLPPMGMGKQGATVRSAIINRAAALHPGEDLASARAGYSSDAASLKKMQAQRDAIGSFEQTAAKNIDIFLNTAGKVVDTGSPMANSLARAVSGKMLGSPNQAAYDAARQVAINEIAKITSNPNLSGSLSDSARHEVDAFNPNSATLKQTVAVMRILKQDMANRTAALDAQLGTIKGRISGKGAPEAGSVPNVGDVKTFPNGSKGQFDGHGWVKIGG